MMKEEQVQRIKRVVELPEVADLQKEINKELPVFKHIKQITITTEPLIKTTTQKVKRYEELKRV